MTVTVVKSKNRSGVYGIDVTTTDANLKALVTSAQILAGGYQTINELDIVITGGPAYVFTGVGATDPISVEAAAAQAEITVTDKTKFAVGDWLLVMETADYTTFEFKRITAIAAATQVITVDSVLSNTYHLADTPIVWKVPGPASFIPFEAAYSLSRDGVDYSSAYVRRMSAVNVRVLGSAVLV